jgi:hypothetical protein
MAQLTHEQYDRLERAIVVGQRIAVMRRGTEFIVIPHRLYVQQGRESIEARNPTTGDKLTLFLDEVERLEIVG